MASHEFSRRGEIIEITIRDQSGRRVDTFKFEKRKFPQFAKIIYLKYGIDTSPVIDEESSVTTLEEEKKKDIDWLA